MNDDDDCFVVAQTCYLLRLDDGAPTGNSMSLKDK